VSQACLGAGLRSLLGWNARTAHTIALLEIPDPSPIAARALAAPGFIDDIERGQPPLSIGSRYGTRVRDDLAHMVPAQGATGNE
jgi:hypothetical protein